ncbi:LacI family DNA-binding transcriptional regulator [Microlunatus capsulatus]|uniref:DNA-binding LacI/PurR family transcriptional regulator n=1 Tax=Microlunatus capsulatus TaxID=99117 RepID=A0ABS4Z243_9ACTN|nr:LacI family DNA-binding transcriptional regulator [Microlunatus capsulatus]MBP2415105.1 DNA-binding LacI/PurR family transcriptional regulator [Microlunatus capsulatus]
MSSPGPEINMKDVAGRAGVAISTVSRALSGAPGVSTATRTRIEAAAAELGYVISPAASNLAGGATKRVAIVVPHLARWICAAMVESLEVRLRAAGFEILIYQVEDADARHRFFAQLPARRKVDAVVVVCLPVSDAERARLDLMGVQVLAAGGQMVDYPFVCIDDFEAARQAVDHLVLLGHRRIAMIDAYDEEIVDWPRESIRHDGYRQALAARSIEVDDQLTVRSGWGGEAAAAAMAALLSLPEPPTAVFAHSDEVALGAVRTIRRAGLRVPEDLSVIGIDDHPFAALTDLTTIEQPVALIATQAAELLLDLLGGVAARTQVKVPTRLVPRATTARPRDALV